ncbi:MAG TPA: FixH family protein [Vicinamibacterales bacterium]|nr:FixH family protein [Vicinamibacterales bacterium]
MRVHWGVGLATAYIGFAAATSGFVAFAMSRPVSLVSPDYYAESLREDEHLAARRNAQLLGSEVAVNWDGGDRIRISVPASQAQAARGSVTLYRASDVAADRTFAFRPDDTGKQDVTVGTLVRGLWLVQLRWSVEGRDYYFEQPVTLK